MVYAEQYARINPSYVEKLERRILDHLERAVNDQLELEAAKQKAAENRRVTENILIAVIGAGISWWGVVSLARWVVRLFS